MVIGKYRDGRDLGYDHATHRFSIGTVGVSARAVADYDSSGQLFWSSEEIRSWFYNVGPDTFDRSVAQERQARETLASLAEGERARQAASDAARPEAQPQASTSATGSQPVVSQTTWQPQGRVGQPTAASQPPAVPGAYAPPSPGTPYWQGAPAQPQQPSRGPAVPQPYEMPQRPMAPADGGQPRRRNRGAKRTTIALVVIAAALLVAAVAIGIYLGGEAFDVFQALGGSGDPLGGDGGSISFMT